MRKTVAGRALMVLSTAVSASVTLGVLAANFLGPQLNLSVTMYSSEASVAEFFVSDGFGNILPDQVYTATTRIGVNNLSFPLARDDSPAPLIQRFDPCECDTPALFEQISVRAPFFSVPVPWDELTPVGSTVQVEGASYVLTPQRANDDPQLVMYIDTVSVLNANWWASFWAVALLSFGFAGLVLGVVVMTRRHFAVVTRSPRRLARRVGEHEIPFVFAIVGIVAGVVGVIQQLAGAIASGVTTDEPAHLRHLSNFFESGQYSSEAYGPAAALFGHALNVAVGTEVWGVPLGTADAYVYRHLSIGLLGVLGTLAVAATAWLLLRSWRWAAIASGVMGAIPLWVGHSMFNLKDVPVATAYTLVTLGLVALFAFEKGILWRGLVAGVSVGAGLLIGVGTRPGVAPFLLGSVVLALAMLWGIFLARRPPRAFVVLSWTVAGLVVTVSAIIAVFTSLGQDLLAGVARSADFPWSGTNLYGGELVGNRPGLLVTVEVFLAYLPVIITLLIAVGLVTSIMLSLQKSPGDGWDSSQRAMLVLIMFQAFGALGAMWLLNPVLYDGGRQILFIVPALALIGTVGIMGTLRFLRVGLGSRPIAEVLVGVTLTISAASVHFDQLSLFPYNYTYYNVAAQGDGISGKWETDYWSSSLKEAAAPIVLGDPSLCGGSGDMNRNIGSTIQPCGSLAPYALEVGPSELASNQFWVVRSERSLARFGPISSRNCSHHSDVARQLRGEEVVMSRLYRCDDL